MSTAKSTGGSLRIPVVNIEGFEEGDADHRSEIAGLVDRAARDVGFMQIKGHGIPELAADGLAEAMDGFFALPFEDKAALKPATPEVNRGYTAPRDERLSYSLGITSPADLFEAFNVGTEAAEFPGLDLAGEHYPANMWPDRPALFERDVEEWMRQAGALANTLTRVFAVALDLPADYFRSYTDHSMDTLRMNRYQLPDGEVRLEPGQLGMGPHTDYGVLTVLWADDVLPGLQILDSEGTWHDVRPAPGALLINLGDLLARWTNDRWISTMHRVLAPIDAEGRPLLRRSAAYFHDGNADAVIDCLPSCVDIDTPRLYEPVTVADHLAAKLAGSRSLKPNHRASREATRLALSATNTDMT
ncbi:isopenicillin N synthase family oxygenase [Amycolatopsis sp. GM8]|uniref:isopenicillin N synthase family dioxygenase n=1 Tax=Amycolatopsis sp. GM8 TaxID=2896530 RepID=UPI001F320F1D|nr:2-oxoglutarate and iron-dependent oxygenase domain-containing protein [Amycolatopsis sp. GM8]